MQQWYSAKDLAGLPGMPAHERSVQRRATRDGWAVRQVSGRGGRRLEYHLDSLPKATRIHLTVQSQQVASALPQTPAARAGAEAARALIEQQARAEETRRQARSNGLAAFEQLPPARQREARGKWELLKARDTFVAASGLPVKRGSELFCHHYIGGGIKVGADARRVASRKGRRSLSWSSLQRWQRQLAEGGLAALAGAWQPRRGSHIPSAQQEFIIGLLVARPHVETRALVEGLRARFGATEAAGYHAVRRFVRDWSRRHGSLFLYLANPDEWKNRHQFAVGNAAEQVARLNQVWELDSTPADILLLDGRYTLIGCIDVYSRRLKLQVCPTSKAAHIAALLRRCLLAWGVPETAKTDNGQDYVSNHLVQVFEDLGIGQQLCPPFTPEGKPHIERAFQTFSHGLLELKPGFIGHNVSERKAIEARKSFAQRLMTREDAVEISLTAADLQAFCDRWTTALYHQREHSALGVSPAEMARAWTAPVRRIDDERALDVLLAEAPKDGGRRTVGKEGLRVDNRDYAAPELAGHEGQRVRVKLDPTDLSRVYAYLDTGEFLCVAIDPSAPNINRAEFAKRVRAEQNRVMNAGRRELKKLARAQSIETVSDEILQAAEAELANVVELPTAHEPYTTAALEQAARAANARDGLAADPFAPLVIEAPPAAAAQPENVVEIPTPIFVNEVELYDHFRQVRQQRPLSHDECARLARAWRDSQSLRQLMEIEGVTLEDFGGQ